MSIQGTFNTNLLYKLLNNMLEEYHLISCVSCAILFFFMKSFISLHQLEMQNKTIPSLKIEQILDFSSVRFFVYRGSLCIPQAPEPYSRTKGLTFTLERINELEEGTIQHVQKSIHMIWLRKEELVAFFFKCVCYLELISSRMCSTFTGEISRFISLTNWARILFSLLVVIQSKNMTLLGNSNELMDKVGLFMT